MLSFFNLKHFCPSFDAQPFSQGSPDLAPKSKIGKRQTFPGLGNQSSICQAVEEVWAWEPGGCTAVGPGPWALRQAVADTSSLLFISHNARHGLHSQKALGSYLDSEASRQRHWADQ